MSRVPNWKSRICGFRSYVVVLQFFLCFRLSLRSYSFACFLGSHFLPVPMVVHQSRGPGSPPMGAPFLLGSSSRAIRSFLLLVVAHLFLHEQKPLCAFRWGMVLIPPRPIPNFEQSSSEDLVQPDCWYLPGIFWAFFKFVSLFCAVRTS